VQDGKGDATSAKEALFNTLLEKLRSVAPMEEVEEALPAAAAPVDEAAARAAARQKAMDDRRAVLDRLEETMKEEIDFEKNQKDITAAGKVVCDKISGILLEYPELEIHIQSHTSCKEGKCVAGCKLMELSQDRVEEVMHYFESQGCVNKFIPKGWGCQHPEIKNKRKVRVFPEDLSWEA
jgi:outer membrane protein OmpA-like peptidoglycan-associated protein